MTTTAPPASTVQSTTATTSTSATKRITQAKANRAVLAAVRIVVAFFFVCHGLLTLYGLWGGIDFKGGAAGFGEWPAWYAGVIETAAGALVFLGLVTRPAALLCSGAMAYAYFTVHLPLGLLPMENMGGEAALFAWVFLLIGVMGPGALAVDNVIRRKR